MMLASQVLAALIVLQCFQTFAFCFVLFCLYFIQLGVSSDSSHSQKNVLVYIFQYFMAFSKHEKMVLLSLINSTFVCVLGIFL